MANYTPAGRQEIEAIASSYPIGKPGSFSVLSGGWENTNYLLRTQTGNFVLTICEQKTEEKAKQLAQLLEYLELHDFETSKLVRTRKNEPLSLWKGKPILCKTYVDGKILESLPAHLIELAGRELGKLHKIEAPGYLPKVLNYGKEQFVDVEKYAKNSHFELWLREKLAYVSPHLEKNLPKAFIHSDVFSDNVIVGEDEASVVLVDFEEASCYYRIFDIGMMIIGTCAEGETVNFDKLKSLLKGYSREIQLQDSEVISLQAFTVYAGAAMTFWRYRNFNYTRPDPGLSDHYMALKILTDFIERQAADYFLKLVR